MTGLSSAFRKVLAVLGAAIVMTAPAWTQGHPRLAALGRLEPGLWQLRDLDDHRQLPPICLGDPELLMQLQHRNSPCSRLVVANDGRGATVHYTCPAGGYGRTSIRVETPRLVQIDTQGIVDNMPFAYRAEGRRVGACDDSGRSRR